jgi:ABC-2 type transport system ATP-binding protein
MRELSHGTRRKIGIVQALAGRPPVLILDEPTSGLDPLMIEAFAQTVAELKRETRTTVFLSSHVLSEAERLCDRVALIRTGRLAALTTLAEIQRAQPRRVTVRLRAPFGDTPVSPDGATLVERDGRRLTFDVRGPLGPLLHALATLPVEDMDVEQFSLEDYVLRLYSA